MRKIDIYTTTALVTSKEKNLANRASYFEKYYIPYLKESGIFTNWSICMELWCWQWHKLEKLIESFPNVHFAGLDRSDEMLSRARIRLPKVRLMRWDVTDLKGILDESKDALCLFQVLHHLSLEDREKVQKEIIRILKPGWHAIIIDTFRPLSWKLKQIAWDSINRFYAVLSQYSAKSLVIRTNNALMSIIMPSKYDPEAYWYFSPTKETVLWDAHPDLDLLQTITPKILNDSVPCISDMMIFKKK